MRELQSLHLNPTAIPKWANLQSESYRKGTTITSVFKIKYFEVRTFTDQPIELRESRGRLLTNKVFQEGKVRNRNEQRLYDIRLAGWHLGT